MTLSFSELGVEQGVEVVSNARGTSTSEKGSSVFSKVEIARFRRRFAAASANPAKAPQIKPHAGRGLAELAQGNRALPKHLQKQTLTASRLFPDRPRKSFSVFS